MLAVLLLIGLGLWPGGGQDREPPSRIAVAPPSVGYPEDWATTLDDAMKRLPFEILIPNHPVANGSNLSAVFVYPDDSAVALQFPPPAEAAAPLRQEYIEVWESTWAGGDPLESFNLDVGQDPAEGKSVLDVEGVPALGVMAHSSSAVDRSNAAFLRFVQDGIDVQISGGESLDLLIEVAKTILGDASPPASPTTS